MTESGLATRTQPTRGGATARGRPTADRVCGLVAPGAPCGGTRTSRPRRPTRSATAGRHREHQPPPIPTAGRRSTSMPQRHAGVQGVDLQAGRAGVADDPPRRPPGPLPERSTASARAIAESLAAAHRPAPERWLLEWLRGQAAAGLLEHRRRSTFELTPEGSAVLADEEGSLLFAAGAFQGAAAHPGGGRSTGRRVQHRHRAHLRRTGRSQRRTWWSGCWRRGRVWHSYPSCFHASTGSSADWSRVPAWPTWAAGQAPRSWPWPRRSPARASRVGTPPSRPSTGPARWPRNGAWRTSSSTSPKQPSCTQDPTFDLVLTFDCLHDMTRPAEAAAAVRRALRPGRHVARQGGEGRRRLGGQPAQPGAGHDVRHVGGDLHVLGPLRARRGRTGHPRAPGVRSWRQCAARRASTAPSTTHDIGDPANLYYEVRP